MVRGKTHSFQQLLPTANIRQRQRWKLGQLNLGQCSSVLRSHPWLWSCPCYWDGRPAAQSFTIPRIWADYYFASDTILTARNEICKSNFVGWKKGKGAHQPPENNPKSDVREDERLKTLTHALLINSFLPRCLTQEVVPAADISAAHTHGCCRSAGASVHVQMCSKRHSEKRWSISQLPGCYKARPAYDGHLGLQTPDWKSGTTIHKQFFPFIHFKQYTLLLLQLCQISIICSKANQSFTWLTIWFNLHTAKKDKGSPWMRTARYLNEADKNRISLAHLLPLADSNLERSVWQ